MSHRPGGGVGTTITQHLKVRPLSKPRFGNRVSEHSVTLLHYGGPPPGHSLLVVVLNCRKPSCWTELAKSRHRGRFDLQKWRKFYSTTKSNGWLKHLLNRQTHIHTIRDFNVVCTHARCTYTHTHFGGHLLPKNLHF